jgi:hypothetical protein
MKLVIHAGLHKTGTTYLQAIMARNRKMLAAHGVHYVVGDKQIASHRIAWAALRSDFQLLDEAIEAAQAAQCTTLLLSSEDFETIVLDIPRAREFEAAATARGITAIEWSMTLREPGEYFASMFSELSRHAYVDPVAMFTSVYRDGRFLVAKPVGHPPDHFELCFDYKTHLLAFVRAISGVVSVYDYAADGPFPGFKILRKLRVGPFDANVPEINRNLRLSSSEMWERYQARLDRVTEAASLSEGTRQMLRDRLMLAPEVLTEMSEAVNQRFLPGMRALLASAGGGRPQARAEAQ